MLIIPEIEKIIILVPRTSTGALYRAIAKRYPQSIMLYRHMEADGVPIGYSSWEKIGLVRHPVARLWSLYKFQKAQAFTTDTDKDWSDYKRAVFLDVAERDFNHWLCHSNFVFTGGYLANGYPLYSRLHVAPETRLSQFQYLRPDLGTRVIKFEDRQQLYAELDIEAHLPDKNRTDDSPPRTLSAAAIKHVSKYCKWDLEQYAE